MPLFALPSVGIASREAPSFVTPLGTLALGLAATDGTFALETPDRVDRVDPATRILAWDRPGVRVEQAHWRAPADCVRERGVDALEVAIWRIEAHADAPPIVLTCRWRDRVARVRSEGPQSGERFESASWTDGGVRATIGSEDGQALADRARAGRWLPARLAPPSTIDWLVWTQWGDDGVSLALPSLRAGERVQWHFACAWAVRELHDDDATELAVDLAYQRPTQLEIVLESESAS